MLKNIDKHLLLVLFIRLIRFSAVFLSIYLVPLWMLIVNQGSVSLKKLFSIILVELAVELLRIATIHTPNSISNTMGMIAAILLGEFAIELGFFSGEILYLYLLEMFVVLPHLIMNYLTNKYVKIFMILFQDYLVG